MPGQSLERDLLKSFREHIDHIGVKACAYRNKQFRYQDQVFDILIDSLDPAYYLALECKSIDADKNKVLYFKKYFSNGKNGHQVEREQRVLELSGRNGFLVVEARRSKPHKPAVFFVPFRIVYHAFVNGDSGIRSEVITQTPSIMKQQGKYLIDFEFMNELYSWSDRQYGKIGSTWRNKSNG